MADIDKDGRQDLISGSWPGEVYIFKRKDNDTFAAPIAASAANDAPLKVGFASSVSVADWDADGDDDLVIGTIDGKIHWVENLDPSKLLFASPKAVNLEDTRKHLSDAAPCMADWDQDGKLDLLVGAEDGSVHWFQNVSQSQNSSPQFSPGVSLVPPSPVGWGSDNSRNPGDWGLRVRPHVADWNNDGRPDLLLGDYCGGFESKPDQSEEEIGQEMRSIQALPALQNRWSKAFKEYRSSLKLVGDNTEQSEETRKLLLAEISSLKNQIDEAQLTIERYQPQRQAHGFVWILTRKPKK